MSDTSKSEYRGIFKATSLFGGVQIWKILIEIIKQKIIAILLGPMGMGITGLLLSSTQFIQGVTSLGLSQSAVRDVADANASGNDARIAHTIVALRRIVWATGLGGMLIVLILSPYLSKSAFGNYDYAIPFAFLSVTLLLQQITAGNSVILQGLRMHKRLAISGILGALGGLIVSIPIYFILKINGIVPALILNAATTLIITWYFSRKIEVSKIDQDLRQTIAQGKHMLKMGIALSFNSVMVLGVGYLIRLFISRIGGTPEVGLYTAGFAIVGGYTGLVFNAMSTDYYPRLSSVNTDNDKCKKLINQQAEIAIIIIAPLAILFCIVAEFAIKLLYSEEFTSIVPYTRYAMSGMIFKAASWAISFVFLAKGDMKLFLFNEVSIKFLNIPLYVVAYYYGGLNGLGLAFVVNYAVYLVLCYSSAYKKYKFKFNNSLYSLFLVELLLVLTNLILVMQNTKLSNYVALIPLVACCLFSYRELDKRIDLSNKLQQVIQKKK